MRRPLFTVCLFLVAIAALRLLLYGIPGGGGQGEHFLPADGETITVTGRVYQRDTQSFSINSIAVSSQQNIPIADNFICEYEESQELSGENTVDGAVTEEVEKIRLGSTVTVQGTFREFRSASNPGEFDTAAYYRTLGIGGRLTGVTLIACGDDYSKVKETLYLVKQYFQKRIDKVFPEKEASILSAMLLGEKESLDSEIKELYKRNGIVHILSISGLHITIIGMGIYKLLRRMGLPVRMAAACGGIVLGLYGVMTGMSLSACRAIGMYLIRMLGVAVGRTYDTLTALGVVAVIMVWRNPAYLNHGGFLLSFGSVLGIGVLYPALLPEMGRLVPVRYEPRKWKAFVDKIWREAKEGLIQSMLAGTSITLFTLPIQLWFYYEVPVYSILLNLLILPFMSLVMMTGLITMLLPGTGIVGTVTCLILMGYERLCEGFDLLPFHTWNPGRPQIWQVVVYYLLVLCVIWRKGEEHDSRSTSFLRAAKGSLYKRGSQNEQISQTRQSSKGEQGLHVKRGFQSEHDSCIKQGFQGERGSCIKQGFQGEQGSCIMVDFQGEQDSCGEKRFHGTKRHQKGDMSSGLIKTAKYIRKPLLLTAAVMIFAVHIRSGATVTFLDVGQGDCAVIETSSGEVYLFDCGSSSRRQVGKYILLPFLKYRGIRHIDGVFVSHPDTDHCSGVLELLQMREEEGITVGQMILPGIDPSMREEEMDALLQAAEGTGQQIPVNVAYIQAGDVFGTKQASFCCLHPPTGYDAEDANAYSQCFYVELYGGKTGEVGRNRDIGISLLLTGDVEGEGEELLLQELKNRDIENVTVLKVAHHGSRYSTGEELLEQINPAYCVISCGRNNSYGHPHEELLERLAEEDSVIIRTDETGAVTVLCGRKQARIRLTFPRS